LQADRNRGPPSRPIVLREGEKITSLVTKRLNGSFKAREKRLPQCWLWLQQYFEFQKAPAVCHKYRGDRRFVMPSPSIELVTNVFAIFLVLEIGIDLIGVF